MRGRIVEIAGEGNKGLSDSELLKIFHTGLRDYKKLGSAPYYISIDLCGTSERFKRSVDNNTDAYENSTQYINRHDVLEKSYKTKLVYTCGLAKRFQVMGQAKL